MIKYLYLVTFEYLVNKDYTSHFDLGVFSTKKSAEEKIRKSVSLTGFNRYGMIMNAMDLHIGTYLIIFLLLKRQINMSSI
mgnify:CR=1 FL=1